MDSAILIIIAFLVTACGTTVEFVQKETAPQRKGIVRYSPTTNPDKDAKYRADLNKKATEFCSGDYQITREFQARDETNTSAGVGTGFGIGRHSSIFVGGSGPSTSMYNFIEFACK